MVQFSGSTASSPSCSAPRPGSWEHPRAPPAPAAAPGPHLGPGPVAPARHSGTMPDARSTGPAPAHPPGAACAPAAGACPRRGMLLPRRGGVGRPAGSVPTVGLLVAAAAAWLSTTGNAAPDYGPLKARIASSGYLAVDPAAGSKLFHVFFEAEVPRGNHTPIILWLQVGGPALSCSLGAASIAAARGTRTQILVLYGGASGSDSNTWIRVC